MAKFQMNSLGAMAVVLASFAIAPVAQANDVPTTQSADIPQAVNEVFFGNHGPFSNTRTLGGQLQVLLGIGGFPERRISKDADGIFDMYNYLMTQQTRQDPTLRVPDLETPYNTSVQYLPTFQTSGISSGSEFIFE